MHFLRRLNEIESRWRDYYNVAPVDDETWRRARIYNAWFDHALIRTFWTNQSEIAPGVFRSNHPTKRRLRRLRDGGLRSVLSLRGSDPSAHNATERIWCEELGLTLHAVAMNDRRAPAAATLIKVIETFRRAERPFLIHCKSGADRAGLVSAMYLMTVENVPVVEARRMLSWRHLHVAGSRAGVLGGVLEAYEVAGAEAAMPFERWVANGYDRADIETRFARRRSGGG